MHLVFFKRLSREQQDILDKLIVTVPVLDLQRAIFHLLKLIIFGVAQALAITLALRHGLCKQKRHQNHVIIIILVSLF